MLHVEDASDDNGDKILGDWFWCGEFDADELDEAEFDIPDEELLCICSKVATAAWIVNPFVFLFLRIVGFAVDPYSVKLLPKLIDFSNLKKKIFSTHHNH